MSDIRILIVEDDPFIAMDLESAVAGGFGDARLIVVDSVSEAREAATGTLACALLDVDVIGGKTFCVAEQLLASGTPVAFVSGSSPNDVPRDLRDVHFVRKPFSPQDIARFVSGALTSGRES